MMGHGSTAGMMAYGDANAIAMEIGEYEVLPVVEEIPVICGVHATDPRRRMWHWLGKVKEMGFSRREQFPHAHHRRRPLPRRARGNRHERAEGIRDGRARPANGPVHHRLCRLAGGSRRRWRRPGADAIIAHVGTTVGGCIGVTNAVVSWDDTIKRTQDIIDAGQAPCGRTSSILCHGGPINTPEDADRVIAGHRMRRLRRRLQPRAHGRGGVADKSDPRVQVDPCEALKPFQNGNDRGHRDTGLKRRGT